MTKKVDIIRDDLPVNSLVCFDWNPNEMNEAEFSMLKETITEVGFIDPVTVIPLEDGKFAIVSGAHRWKAACALKMETIPADILQGDKWKDTDLQKFQNLRLNTIRGNMNPEKFLALYNEMAAKFGKEKVAKLMGYTNETQIKKIIKNVAKEMKASLPPEMAKQFEEQAKEARTVGDMERIIQHLFQEHGDSVKYNFMVFAWGGKEHTYIAASKKVHQAMKKILAKSRLGSIDINELIGDAIEEVADSLDDKPNGTSEDHPRA